MRHRILYFLLCIVLTSAFAGADFAWADQESDLQSAVDQNQSELDNAVRSIEEQEGIRKELTEEIGELDQQLIALLSSIDLLNGEIADTEDRIKEKEASLAEAEGLLTEQYSDMETRIRYIYENGNAMGWLTYILNAESFRDLLNRVVYAQDLNRYDRDQLALYQLQIETISTIKDELTDKQDLLKEEESELEDQQVQLEGALAEKKAESDHYEEELAELRVKADELTRLIASQNEEIRRIQEEKAEAIRRAQEEAERRRKEAEEAAARAAEEEARRAAEAEAQAQREAETAQEAEEQEETERTSEEETQEAEEQTREAAEENGGEAREEAAEEPAPLNMGNKGQQIADFACQFVGNPYVQGQCSLTEGCDCAGFVHSVYKHFGVELIRNPVLQGTTYGRQISYDNMKPGDIIAYTSHVAIYIGNGQIVHAANEELGIIISDNPLYRPIVGIARIFDY